MANKDQPRGFYPLEHMFLGAIPAPHEHTLTTGQIVYQGDLLKAMSTGTVEESDANDGAIVIGVAAEYKDGTVAGTKVLVYDDPWIIFGVQADSGTAPTAADVHATANHAVGAGNATTKQSGHELDSSDIGTGAQLKILGKVEVEDNEWGEHVDLKVLINEHFYKAAVNGV